MRKLIVATRNRDKFREIKADLAGIPFTLTGAFEVEGLPEVVEDQETLEANALKKAREVSAAARLPALADDTGLFVDALGGAPGVCAARYAGEGCTYADNVRKLLSALEGVPLSRRTALFRTVVAVQFPGEEPRLFEGEVAGVITLAAAGEGGFGYDPVFQPLGFHQTFAEMSSQDKNAVSHRGLALLRARKWLETRS